MHRLRAVGWPGRRLSAYRSGALLVILEMPSYRFRQEVGSREGHSTAAERPVNRNHCSGKVALAEQRFAVQVK